MLDFLKNADNKTFNKRNIVPTVNGTIFGIGTVGATAAVITTALILTGTISTISLLAVFANPVGLALLSIIALVSLAIFTNSVQQISNNRAMENAKAPADAKALETAVETAVETVVTSKNLITEDKLNKELSVKANVQDLKTLEDRVQANETALNAKANAQNLTTLEGRVQANETKLADTSALDAKANAQDLTTLEGRVQANETKLADTSALDAKLNETALEEKVKGLLESGTSVTQFLDNRYQAKLQQQSVA